MVICNFHIHWPILGPNETNAILIIYSDTVLPLSVTRQQLQSISGRNSQFVKSQNRIQSIKFSKYNIPKALRTNFSSGFCRLAVENFLCGFVFKGLYPENTIARLSCYFKLILLSWQPE